MTTVDTTVPATGAAESTTAVAVTASPDAAAFHDALTAVHLFTAKDPTRPILESVAVEYVTGGEDGLDHILLTATDSHRLLSVAVPAELSGATTSAALIHRDTVKAMIGAVKPAAVKYAAEPVRLSIDHAEDEAPPYTRAGTFDNGAGATLTFSTVAGEFPRWRSLIPSVEDMGGGGDGFVAYNPAYLAAIAKAFSHLAGKGSETPVRLRFDTPTRPGLFTMRDSKRWPEGCPDPVAILMPVKTSS